MFALSFLGADSSSKNLAVAKGKVIEGDSHDYEVRKVSQDGMITLQVLDTSSKLIWKSEEIGSEEKKFTIGGKAESLFLKDISKDGIPEIVTAAFYGPRASALYIFSYSSKTKSFEPIKCRFPKDGLVRDFVVSDIFQENGSDILFESDEKLKILGMIYPDDPEKAPTEGVYFFAFQNGEFIHTKTEPVLKENGNR